MARHREPWERQVRESAPAFEAFAHYRDMGAARSQRAVAQKLNKSLTQISRWAVRWEWVERALAWDDHVDEQERLELLEEQKAMRKRHARIANAFLAKVVERVQNINPEDIGPGSLARWLEAAVKIERLSRGESTEYVEQQHSGKVLVDHGDEVREQIMENPRLAALATDFFAELESHRLGEGDARGTGEHGESDVVEDTAASPDP